MCGEHLPLAKRFSTDVGSSPRVRGASARSHLWRRCCRIIPACAGSISFLVVAPALAWDHPRVCGEHGYDLSKTEYTRGSSPRVRGAYPLMSVSSSFSRIIPACAGSIRPALRPRGTARDHPRVCGEHRCVTARDIQTKGSSPRVRGASKIRQRYEEQARIIPACAGSMKRCASSRGIRSDHPRVCGEHFCATSGASFSVGSSPRVRGASLLRRVPLALARIIPACAGSMYSKLASASVRSDHPRVCGEHPWAARYVPVVPGSSPRVRGAWHKGYGVECFARIIPACAGSIRIR